MKKIFALLLVVCLLFVFASCEKAPKPDLSNNDDVSEIVMDKDNESENDINTDKENSNEANSNSETISDNESTEGNETVQNNDVETPYGERYMLLDILMFKITKNYYLTCPLEFNEGDVVPFKDVFYYYTFAACYTFDEKCIEPELVKYYDPKTMDFSVPHKIVDDYIESIFNTKADPESVEYYNKDKGTYDFDRHLGECYYDFKVLRKRNIKDSKYEFSVLLTNNVGTGETITKTFIVELNADSYKILSHKSEKKTVNTGDGYVY